MFRIIFLLDQDIDIYYFRFSPAEKSYIGYYFDFVINAEGSSALYTYYWLPLCERSCWVGTVSTYFMTDPANDYFVRVTGIICISFKGIFKSKKNWKNPIFLIETFAQCGFSLYCVVPGTRTVWFGNRLDKSLRINLLKRTGWLILKLNRWGADLF
jgi:hypothetical protein